MRGEAATLNENVERGTAGAATWRSTLDPSGMTWTAVGPTIVPAGTFGAKTGISRPTLNERSTRARVAESATRPATGGAARMTIVGVLSAPLRLVSVSQ